MNVASDIINPYSLFREISVAAGPDACHVGKVLEGIRDGFENSVFLFGNAQTALAALMKLASETTEDGWDGEDGSKMAEGSLNFAVRLLKEMPREWAVPTVDLDPDGEVSLQWYGGPDSRLSISVGNSGKISYAWILPSENGKLERVHGIAESDGLFPPTISEAISKLCAQSAG